MSTDTTDKPVVLRLDGVVKTFPGVRALDGVELEVRAGEVHCLLGQNGAGKSTLIKVLSGVHKPDEGTVEWLGETVASPARRPPCAPASPPSTRSSISSTTCRWRRTSSSATSRAAWASSSAGRRHGVPRDFGSARPRRRSRRAARSGRCRRGQAGRLDGPALSHEAKLIIMDEPSAVLAHDEVANLFRIIRELTAQGIAVIYISHRLEEIREIGDRVTVLKDGRTTAANLPARTTPTRDLVSRMTGRNIEYVFPARPAPSTTPAADAPLLEVRGLTRHGRVRRHLPHRPQW
jgi:ribose transport system ATP-binding protein